MKRTDIKQIAAGLSGSFHLIKIQKGQYTDISKRFDIYRCNESPKTKLMPWVVWDISGTVSKFLFRAKTLA